MSEAAASRILLVEDDDELASVVAGRLGERYAVERVAGGQAALEAVARTVPDVVLLDVMLPGMDGLEVCRRLRAAHPLLHIIMLTARSEELDRVVGLEVGADDYVTKPFSLRELEARVKRALSKQHFVQHQATAAEGDPHPLAFDALRIDPVRREVTRSGELVHLTVREYDLLYFLAAHADRPFSRTQLLDKIWDIQFDGYDRTIDSHVQRLRAKVEDDPGNPRYIRTVWGVGYKFASEAG